MLGRRLTMAALVLVVGIASLVLVGFQMRHPTGTVAGIVDPVSVRAVPVPVELEGGTFLWSPLLNAFAFVGVEQPGVTDIYVMDADGSNVRKLLPQESPDCDFSRRGNLAQLPDGRLTYREDCGRTPPGRSSYLEANAFWVLDPRTGERQELLPYYLGIAAVNYSFDPTFSRGLVQYAIPLREELRWLYPDHWEPVPLTLGRVGPPIWSPDGQTVFLSAMDPSDDEGMSRLDGSWTLYAMNPNTLALRPLATAVIGPVGGTWSPDSQWFAASADLDGQGSQIQLIHVPSGRIFTLRLPMKVTLPVWSLDGRTLVTTPARLRPPEGGLSVPGTELHVIELPDLDAPIQNQADSSASLAHPASPTTPSP